MASHGFGVFLSYRRDDAAGHAGRLADTLAGRFGSQSVFIDVDSIEPGADFVAALTEALRRCQVMLVVVGTRWIDSEVGGRRRLDDPDDFVRMELEFALQRGLRVVPVLVGGATMPSRESLPSALEAFARCNAYEMSDRAWNESSRILLDLIERWRETDEPSERVSAVGEDGPEPSREGSDRRRSAPLPPRPHDSRHATTESPSVKQPRSTRSLLSRRRIFVGAATALVVLVGVLVNLSVNGSARNQRSPTSRTPVAAGYTPRFVAVSCPAGTGGGPGVTCGDLVVPQDRAHPKGLQVRLLVTQAPAETPSPAADPVVDLGGPFDPTAFEGPSSTTRLYSNYIKLSVRGGRGSVPDLACPEVEAATEASLALPVRSSAAMTEQVTALSACRARLVAAGIDPNAYGNDAMAADVRDLLHVLRIRQANFLATGNGSLLAFDIMRQYPELVRSVAIEDGIPPGFDGDAAAVDNLAGALNRYTAICSNTARCHAAFPDIRGQIRRDYARFQQHPVTVKVSVQPGRAPIKVLVNGDSADEAMSSALSAAASLPIAASVLYAPNPALVAQGIVIFNVGNGNLISWGELASYVCKDLLPGVPDNRRIQEQASALAYPQLAGADGGFQLELRACQAWNVQPDNPSDFTPIVSDVPTFLFGGALNPGVSPTWSGQIAQGLAHAAVGTFGTLTGLSLQDSAAPACLTTLRIDFLRNPTAHLDIAGCQAQSPPIAFAGT